MPKYNHTYDIAFSLVSEKSNGDDVTPEMIKAALHKHIEDLDSEGDLAWHESIGGPFDTYSEEE
jgi:hypothetical protein|tara:strand:- start:1887 stop:2078 length:192 start_codon:yes stop_codon:yes gene_type:complete